jgi:hypothetical protein
MHDAAEGDIALLVDNDLRGHFMSYIFAPLAKEAFSPMISCLSFLCSRFPGACAVARDAAFAHGIVVLASRHPAI